ncbi:hypothetical protein BX070DRAFT_228435 [Coemansia spiralis]|nr:hypothetical protein BX070DRAFT_228435 [Coemansia spiralis]
MACGRCILVCASSGFAFLWSTCSSLANANTTPSNKSSLVFCRNLYTFHHVNIAFTTRILIYRIQYFSTA